MTSRRTLRPSVVAALILIHGVAFALPQDAKPVFGKTSVSQPGNGQLRIDQATARAGIDWASFSIAAGETVRVVQPDASSVLVNRVTGLDPSLILGRLQANGRVFLTNPRGVIFGEGAQVDVGGLAATTLKLGDADAQAGRWWLQPVEGAAAVVNEGQLRAPGGTIALVAPQVINRGSIEAARIGLAAVGEVQVDLDGDGLILLNARPTDAARLDQLGTLNALGGRAEMIAAARGQVAGTVLNLRGAVQSRGFSGQGGEIVIDGGANGIVEVGAVVDASSTSGRGGDVLLLGQKLLLDDGARILAGGQEGGGRVRIGGDFHGDNTALHNSEMLLVRPGASIDASAGLRGDGGQVVLWSEQSTRVFGRITATGGAQGGDGGNAEVSSRHLLDFHGAVDLGAARGRLGRLLLDPQDITIADANADTALSGDVAFSDSPPTPTFAASEVSSLLLSTSLTLQATHDITVQSAVSGNNRLTLQAGNNITVNAPISTAGLTLSANDNGAGTASGSGRVITSAALNAGGFDLVIANNGSSGVHSLGGNLSGDSLALTGDAALTAAQTWSFASNSLPYFGRLSGTAVLTLAGSGVVDFMGDNSGYSGDINLATGTLRLSGANAAGGTGTINVAGGAQLDVEGITLANAQLRLAAGATLGNVGSDPAVIAGSVVLQGDATVDASIGALALQGPVTESGSGRSLTTQGSVTLSGTGSYTGATTIASGTLTLQGSSASTAFITSSGTLNVAGAGLLAAAPALLVSGSGQVNLDGSQTVSSLDDRGGSGGLVQLVSGSLAITNSSGSSSFGGSVQGAGSLQLLGGTLTLSGSNSYTGSTTVSGGTLFTSGSGALPAASTLALGAGGSVQLGADATIAALQGSGGSLDLGAHQLTVGDASSTSFDGSISGPGGTLLKQGSGRLTLNGSSSFGGGATVAAGTLALGAAERLADGLPVTVQSGATLQLNGNETIGSLQLAGRLAGSGTLSATSYAINGGTIDAAIGAGTLTSTGTSQINGSVSADVTVSAGTLGLGSAERIADTASLVVNSGATLLLAGNERVGTLNLQGSTGGTGTLSAATALLSGASYSAAIVADGIQSSGSNIISGTLTAPQINVAGGSLVLASAGRLQGAPALTLAGGSQLTLGGDEALGWLSGSGSVALGSATLSAGARGDSTFAGTLSGSGTLAKTGSSTFTLTGSNGHGSTTILGGVLVVGDGASTGALGSGPVSNNAVLRLDRGDAVNFGNVVSGSGQLQFSGSGSTTVSAASSYSGGTLIENGRVLPVSAGQLGTGPVTLSGAGAVLELSNGAALANALVLAGGTVVNVSGSGTVGGVVTLQADSALAGNGGGLLVNGVIGDGGAGFGLAISGLVTLSQDNLYSGRTTVASGQLTLGTGGSTGGVGGPITINGTLRVNRGNAVLATNAIDGNGALLLDTPAGITMVGANSFTGSTELRSGTLAFSGAGANSGTGTLLLDGTTLDIANGAVVQAAVISNGGTVSNSSGSGTLAGSLTLQSASALRSDGSGLRVSGGIGDGGSGVGFTTSGSGRVELTAANSFGGAVNVASGTLVASHAGALGSTAQGTTVAAGAALEVNGVTLAAEPLLVSGSGVAGSGALLGNGGLSGPVTLVGDTAVGGSLNFNGAIGEQGTPRSLTKVGSGTVTLAAVNGYTGSTTVASGTLALGVADALPNTSMVVDGGTLDTGVYDNHLPALSLRNGSISGSSGAIFSASDFDLRSGSVSAVLAGSSGISKTTAGTVTLSGNNRFTGSTAVQAGTLALAGDERLADSGSVTVSPGATLSAGGNETITGLLLQGTLAGSGRLTAASTSLDGGSVDGNLGGGPLASTGNSTINGLAAVNAISVDSGRLTLASAGRLTATPAVTLQPGAVLALGGANSVGSVTGSGTVDLGSAPLTLGGAADFSFAGQFIGAGGIAKQGSGTLTLQAAQGYAGATQVLAGTLLLPAAERLPDSTALTLAGGATLQLAGGDETVASATLGGHLVGPGRLSAALVALAGGTVDTNLGAGTLTSSGSSLLNGSSAATTVNVIDGTLTLGSAQRLADAAAVSVQAPGTLRLNGNQSVQTLDLSGVLTGSGTFTATGSYALNSGSRVDVPLGAGTLNVDGNSTLNQAAGATTVNVNAGTLTIAQTGDLANQATVSVASNATLAVNADQTVGALALSGNVAGSGTLAATSLVTSGNAAAVLTTLQVDQGVTITSGKLTIGDGATSGSLVAPSTTVGSGATLAFNRSDQVAVGAIGGSGTLRQDGSGTLQLTGSAASIGAVEVASGTLALAGGGHQINSAATVAVSAGGTLALGGSGETIAALTLQGKLAGSGSTLTAGSYTLNGGVAEANLGAGALSNVGGNSVIGGIAAVTSVSVSGGTLAVAGSQALQARPPLDVQAGATLRLTGTQSVGTVTNAGTLVTGAALNASSFSGNGAVQIGGSITTTGNQSYGGALSTSVANPSLVAGGDIVALAPGNDFNGATLALQARSVRLFGGGQELRLGTLNLGSGDSQISAAGRVVLAGAAALTGGSLTVDAQGLPGDGASIAAAGGATALLPDPGNGAASATRLLLAESTISQTAQGDVTLGATATLHLRASGGGSIDLGNAGNAWAGSVSAVSGSGTGFSFPSGQSQLRLSRVRLQADALHLVADGGATLPGSDPVTALAAAGSNDAVRADLVSLKAASISTAPGAQIRARLPYSLNQGASTSARGLVIDTTPATGGGGQFGSVDNPLAIVVNSATLGIGGLFLAVLPEPQNGGSAGQKLYLACAGCGNAPVYQYGGDPLAAQTWFNGTLLGSTQLSGSTINSNTTLLENARRGLFEGAVRTENVAPRLRAGVIAEVGMGRPATEGDRGIRLPVQCEGLAGSLDCASP